MTAACIPANCPMAQTSLPRRPLLRMLADSRGPRSADALLQRLRPQRIQSGAQLLSARRAGCPRLDRRRRPAGANRLRRPEPLVDRVQRPGARYADLLRLPSEPDLARGGLPGAARPGPNWESPPGRSSAVANDDRQLFAAIAVSREIRQRRSPSWQPFYNQWNFGFNLNWELDFWGRFRRAIESDAANLDASVEGYDDVLVTLLGDVATNYVQMRTLEGRIEYAQANVRIAAADVDDCRGPLQRRHDQRTRRLPGPQHPRTDRGPNPRVGNQSPADRRSNCAS